MTNTNNTSSTTNTKTTTGIASIILLVLVAMSATVFLFKTSYNASDLSIVPDSVEYAIGANNIVTSGEYTILLNGEKFPPRYPPWFSLLILAPAYLIFGTAIGNAIYSITFFAVVGIVAAFMLGKHISGDMGGLLAALALLLHPLYRNYAGTIMTDVPCVALILLGCLLYLKIKDRSEPSSLLYISAGLLAALCAAMRPACGSVILPFVFLATFPLSRPKKLLNLAALLSPALILVIISAYYNSSTFGNALRTGYHFWCPVPYDFPDLTFSLNYIPSNIKALETNGSLGYILASIAIITIFSFKPSLSDKMKTLIWNTSLFAALAVGPIALFHLIYFFPSSRLFMPVISLLLVIAVATVATPLRIRPKSIMPIILQTLILVGFILFRTIIVQAPPPRRSAVDRVNNITPPDTLVITAIDPVYMEFMTNRKILPISRNVEYASKITAKHKLILGIKPKHWADISRENLLAAGGIDPVPVVSTDHPLILINRLKSGEPVCIEISRVTYPDRAIASSMQKHLILREKATGLYKVTTK